MTSSIAVAKETGPRSVLARAPPRSALQLHVVFARRRGRRFITNVDELLIRCSQRSTVIAPPVSVRCSAHWLGELPLVGVVSLLRQTDIFVAMHGGDVLNALHLRPGSAVIEVVNEYMAQRWKKASRDMKGIPFDGWLEQDRQVLLPLQRFERLIPPPPRLDAATKTWNDDVEVPWPQLEHTLRKMLQTPDVFTGIRASVLRLAADRRWTQICCDPGGISPMLLRAVNVSFAKMIHLRSHDAP